ncbi:MAG: hypothetical protein WCJ09_12340 [Planctomycetota bacterium]
MAGKSRHNLDDVIIEALARGETQTAVAKLAGVSATTIRRRLEDSGFRSQIERFRETMLDSAAGQLGAILTQAVTTLEGLLIKSTPPAVRLAAAKSVIELTIRTREVLSWEKRIAELESRLNTPQNEATE